MERELEKTLMEMEYSIKSHEQRGNTHTQSVLEQARDIIAICAEATRTPSGLREMLRRDTTDGWIPVERNLPPNAKYIGALCPRYQLDTKYGVTEGWYNPDLESWFVLVWFMTERYLDSEIDFERGAHPRIVRFENEVSEKHRVVLAWRPLPESYRPKKESEGSRRLREREEFFKE